MDENERLKRIREKRRELQRAGRIKTKRRGGRKGIPNVSAEHPNYMSLAQVSIYTGLTIPQVRRATSRGELPDERVGKHRIFRRRVVAEWWRIRLVKEDAPTVG